MSRRRVQKGRQQVVVPVSPRWVAETFAGKDAADASSKGTGRPEDRWSDDRLEMSVK